MKTFLVIFLIATSILKTNAQGSPKAEDFFKTSTILTFDTNIKPEQLIGTIIYYKLGDKDNFEYLPILSPEQMKKYEPTYNNKILFQTMATKETVASVKYLAFFNATVGVKNLLEVVLEDVLDYRVPSFTTDLNVKTQTFLFAEPLIRLGYIVEYIDNVNYCSLTTRLFAEQKVGVSGNYFVSADAKQYSSTSEFATKRLISLHSIKLNPFVSLTSQLGGSIAKLNAVALSESSTSTPLNTDKYQVINTLKLGSLKTIIGEN